MAYDSLPFPAKFFGANAAVPDAARVFSASYDVAELRSHREASARPESCARAESSAYEDRAVWNVAESDLEVVCSMDRSMSHMRRLARDGYVGDWDDDEMTASDEVDDESVCDTACSRPCPGNAEERSWDSHDRIHLAAKSNPASEMLRAEAIRILSRAQSQGILPANLSPEAQSALISMLLKPMSGSVVPHAASLSRTVSGVSSYATAPSQATAAETATACTASPPVVAGVVKSLRFLGESGNNCGEETDPYHGLGPALDAEIEAMASEDLEILDMDIIMELDDVTATVGCREDDF
ncbi:unnamed protein product [Closterium sp. Yama58-4]|nr:unnamed protein product [Closterium sp. Yama58-4]